MDRETYKQAQAALAEISRHLADENLSEQDRAKLEKSKAQLAGQLLSIWVPFDWGRRLIMVAHFFLGLYGLIEGRLVFLIAWLALVFFSPRAVGELTFLIGKFSR